MTWFSNFNSNSNSNSNFNLNTRKGGYESVRRLKYFAVFFLVVFCLVICVCVANVEEPRHAGKWSMLEQMRAIEPTWVLPHALVSLQQQQQQLSHHDISAFFHGIAFPLILKPNRFTNRGKGVHIVRNAREASDALEALRLCMQAGQWNGKIEVLVQALATTKTQSQTRVEEHMALELRLFGTQKGDTFQWLFAMEKEGLSERALPVALEHRLTRAVREAWPRTQALAIDIWSSSWAAFLRGEFYILEANGSFGIPLRHTSQVPWHDRHVLGRGTWVDDAVLWFCTRVAHGVTNITHGRISLARLSQEVGCFFAYTAVSKAFQNDTMKTRTSQLKITK